MVTARGRPIRPAFLTADVLLALAVVGMLGVLLTRAVGSATAASNKLASDRAAVRLAEAALLAVETNAPFDDSRVTMATDATAPATTGGHWVTARATVDGRTVELTGWVAGGGR